ncbi:MAG TPA: CHAT domain-containing protein [Actinobacteria bacterium]|nr:CHAT domain-containing protein [Actinomycetota bacterium]
MPSSAEAAIEAALDCARSTPHRALELLAEVPSEERTPRADLAEGLARRLLGELVPSTRLLERAAADAQDPRLRGIVLRSLAFNYEELGRAGDADAAIEESISLLEGYERSLSILQRAFLAIARGRYRDAFAALEEAASGIDPETDPNTYLLVLHNRAVVAMETGRYRRAAADLDRAHGLAVEVGDLPAAADAALHRSQVAAWLGRIPEALGWFRRSRELRKRLGRPDPVGHMEHAIVLVEAGLDTDAELVLREALPHLAAADRRAQAHLLLGRLALGRGEPETAAAEARRARDLVLDDSRFHREADALEARAAVAAHPGELASVRRLVDAAAAHRAAGELLSARSLLVDAAVAFADLGRLDDAEAALRRAGSGRSGPLRLQVRWWFARARLRHAAGRRAAAWRALEAAVRRLERHLEGLGAPDLRARALDEFAPLFRLGVDLAVDAGAATRVVRWIERTRLLTLPLPADADPELEALRATLRRLGGTTDPETRRRRLRLERRVVALAHEREGGDPARRAAPRPPSARPETHTEILYAEGASGLVAVVSDSGGRRLHPLPEATALQPLLDHLAAAFGRLSRHQTSPRSVAAAVASIGDLVARLREGLVTPLEADSPPVVVLPTGWTRRVPWSLLFDEPPTVATLPGTGPRIAPLRPRRPVVVAASGLADAGSEARAVADLLGVSPTPAVRAEVLAACEDADLLHLATHGELRSDRPLLSALFLDDGPMHLLDLHERPRVPTVVVLAACGAGGPALGGPAGALGFAEVLVGRGSRVVIAPSYPVRDDLARRVVVGFYRHLGAGTPPGAALAAAGEDDDLVGLTARSFLCLAGT